MADRSTHNGAAPEGPALLCYDGSADAASAIAVAGRLLHGGPAVVVTAWQRIHQHVVVPVPGLAGQVRGGIAELDEIAAEHASECASEGVEKATAAGFRAQALAEPGLGSAWHAIVAAADRCEAAVIVLGARGRGDVAATLLGSTSQAVAHHAQRPVLIVPPPE